MKPKDLFNLAVRLLGLLFLYHGSRSIPAGFAQVAGALPGELGFGGAGSFAGFFIGVLTPGWPLVLAWWLIGGAPLIARRAYPETTA
jgi:hypothetical protein